MYLSVADSAALHFSSLFFILEVSWHHEIALHQQFSSWRVAGCEVAQLWYIHQLYLHSGHGHATQDHIVSLWTRSEVDWGCTGPNRRFNVSPIPAWNLLNILLTLWPGCCGLLQGKVNQTIFALKKTRASWLKCLQAFQSVSCCYAPALQAVTLFFQSTLDGPSASSAPPTSSGATTRQPLGSMLSFLRKQNSLAVFVDLWQASWSAKV